MVESVKKGFGVMTKSLDLVLVLFVFGFITNFINISMNSQVDPNQPVQIQPLVIAFIIAVILLTIFTQAGSVGYVRERYKQGTASLGSFFSLGAKYYVPMLVVGILISLFVVLMAVLIGLLLQATNNSVVVRAAVFSLVVLIILFFIFAPYAVVVDEKGPFAAIKRSIGFVRGHFLSVVALLVALVAIGAGIGILLGVVLALVNTLTGPGLVFQTLFSLLSAAVNSFLGIWVTGTLMAYYLSNSNPNNP